MAPTVSSQVVNRNAASGPLGEIATQFCRELKKLESARDRHQDLAYESWRHSVIALARLEVGSVPEEIEEAFDDLVVTLARDKLYGKAWKMPSIRRPKLLDGAEPDIAIPDALADLIPLIQDAVKEPARRYHIRCKLTEDEYCDKVERIVARSGRPAGPNQQGRIE